MSDKVGLTKEHGALARFWGYLGERFPLVPYGALVALFFGSAAAVARAFGGGSGHTQWGAAAVMLLVFFHLRIFDEHKDMAVDVQAHPDRLLSRGVVTLRFLARCGFAAIVLELVIAALLGPTALSWWALVFGFTLAMRYEFGLGAWLNRHLLVYALSHNPVVALLGCFAWASTGTAFDDRYWVYLALVTMGSFAFEMGRKTRLPEEEIPGVESYSSVLGRKQAGVFLAFLAIGTAAAAWALCHLLAAEWYAYAAAGVAGVFGLWPALAGKGEKAVEGGASLLLLGAMGAAWLAA